MVKKQAFDPKAFSLVINCGETSQIVPIPITKKGLGKSKVGGEQTYQMAIDDFTIKFSNKNELLDYIKKQGLANIQEEDYGKIYISIIYNGDGEFTGNLSVVYSSQKELANFIKNNPINGNFPLGNPYVENFNQTIINYATAGIYRAEYMMFMTNNKNPYFGSDLINTLKQIRKEGIFDRVKAGDAFIAPIGRYHNLRGHLMLGKRLEEELERIYITKLVSPQERHEQKPSINIEIVKMPQTKAKPAGQQLPHQYTSSDNYEKHHKTK